MSAFSHLTDFVKYVDIAGGLGRIGGNQKIYARLLTTFIKSDYSAQMREQAGGEDLEAAAHTAHTVKGVAANLSLTQLQQQSATLEQQLKAGQLDAAQVDVFCNTWDITLAYVKEIIAAVEAGTPIV